MSGARDSLDSSHCGDDIRSIAVVPPVSPSTIPLSASSASFSSLSEGWKYSSQRLLWKLKPRQLNFSHSSTSSSTDSAWKSQDSTTWRSVDGVEVVLRGTRLEVLSDIERNALHQIAIVRLNKMLPGVNIAKPKDTLSTLRKKRQKLMKGSRTLTVTETLRRASGISVDEEKRVFGVSLSTAVENDRCIEIAARCRSLDDSAVCLNVPAEKRKNFKYTREVAKSVRSESEIIQNEERTRWLYPHSPQTLAPTSPNPSCSAPPTCSINEKTHNHEEKQRAKSTSFCSFEYFEDECDTHIVQVPRIVAKCTDYLTTYGMNTVGLFRVAGSAKRCRLLKQALERVPSTSMEVLCGEDTTPHDVATILKEFFRDLPEPLLPKEHYQAYIAAARLGEEERVECLHLLVSMMSRPSVDTLVVLLAFLQKIAANCADQLDEAGEIMTLGNKMDAHNLATVFAPSILRSDHHKLQTTLIENEQQIVVVETMIEHAEDIFTISRELQSKIFSKLRDTEPDRLDRILNGLSRQDGHEYPLISPFPATAEESEPKSARLPDEGHHLTNNNKGLSGWRGSWPFPLTRNSRGTDPTPSTAVPTPPPPHSIYRQNNHKHSSPSPSPTARQSSASDVFSFRNTTSSAVTGARRRLRSVARAFRFSMSSRSTPDVSEDTTV